MSFMVPPVFRNRVRPKGTDEDRGEFGRWGLKTRGRKLVGVDLCGTRDGTWRGHTGVHGWGTEQEGFPVSSTSRTYLVYTSPCYTKLRYPGTCTGRVDRPSRSKTGPGTRPEQDPV